MRRQRFSATRRVMPARAALALRVVDVDCCRCLLRDDIDDEMSMLRLLARAADTSVDAAAQALHTRVKITRSAMMLSNYQ